MTETIRQLKTQKGQRGSEEGGLEGGYEEPKLARRNREEVETEDGSRTGVGWLRMKN